MIKSLFEANIEYCDFCEVLIADGLLQNGKYICYPCCDNAKIPHTPEPAINLWWQYR